MKRRFSFSRTKKGPITSSRKPMGAPLDWAGKRKETSVFVNGFFESNTGLSIRGVRSHAPARLRCFTRAVNRTRE